MIRVHQKVCVLVDNAHFFIFSFLISVPLQSFEYNAKPSFEIKLVGTHYKLNVALRICHIYFFCTRSSSHQNLYLSTQRQILTNITFDSFFLSQNQLLNPYHWVILLHFMSPLSTERGIQNSLLENYPLRGLLKKPIIDFIFDRVNLLKRLYVSKNPNFCQVLVPCIRSWADKKYVLEN